MLLVRLASGFSWISASVAPFLRSHRLRDLFCAWARSGPPAHSWSCPWRARPLRTVRCLWSGVPLSASRAAPPAAARAHRGRECRLPKWHKSHLQVTQKLTPGVFALDGQPLEPATTRTASFEGILLLGVRRICSCLWFDAPSAEVAWKRARETLVWRVILMLLEAEVFLDSRRIVAATEATECGETLIRSSRADRPFSWKGVSQD
jgi:hypothetical protein